MIRGKKHSAGRQIEVVCKSEPLTGLSDNQLLGRFLGLLADTREQAFRELVHRHGPMVMGVCRQVLRHPHDAEDAFQATFLILVLKARSIRVAESLAPWLQSVAYRTAQRARTTSSRYCQGDRHAMEAVETNPQDADHLEIRRVLQEELALLPDKYRVPIVLCHFEGKTHEEAARLLRWPVGTVSGRLSRGRDLLKSRLERRGFAVPSAITMIPWLDLTQSIPDASIESALTAAMQFAASPSLSASVLSLTHGVLKTMFVNRLKTISLAVFAMGVVSGVVWAHRPSVTPQQRLQAGALAASLKHDAEATAVANSNSSQPLAAPASADCPLASIEDAPPGCPIAMAANAVSRMLSYFHDNGSGSSE